MTKLPEFSNINISSIKTNLEKILKNNLAKIEELKKLENKTWDNFILPQMQLDDALHNFWSPISHLNSVKNSDELREAYESCLPILTEYGAKLGQDEVLFNGYMDIQKKSEFNNYSQSQKQVINHSIRDFKLSGVNLDKNKKEQYIKLSQELSLKTNQFSNNILDSTDGWKKLIENKNNLAGIPSDKLKEFENNARKNNQSGFLLNLQFPCYHAVITYCENRELRKEIYTAYCTRASDQGPHDSKFNNSDLMAEIVSLRQQLAKLLGFDNYADYSLATKMADKSETVLNFLDDLARKSYQKGLDEYQELKVFSQLGDELQSWDISFYSEKLKQQNYAISDEQLRPYFPEPVVSKGLFDLASKLYNLEIKENKKADLWENSVKYFDIFRNNKKIAGFYCDLFARQHKRGGAWMDECTVRFSHENQTQLPIAYLTCNFTAPCENKPALLTFDEVLTLFHEFGHGLHHMLTKIDFPPVSGINGVPWDAVELPSQFMENFCYEREVIDLISSHIDSQEKLPNDLFNKLIAAKNFQSALQMLRQCEFALFDFKLHQDYQKPSSEDIQNLLDTIRKEFAAIPVPSFNRFQHSFSHIFAGGYAAGYYSYKWAEVLSCDAYGKFKEEGIFNPNTAQSFLENILEKGGSEEMMDLFKAFRGREPNVEALLVDAGIN